MSATLTAPPDADVEQEQKGGGGKKKLVIVVVLLLVLGGAGYWFFLKPSGPIEPEPGEVVTLEPIQVNLAEGHYLRIGVALQFTADAAHPEGSKALDAVIELFSGQEQAELVKASHRKELKHQLEETLDHDYHGEVMEVFFTEFVTQ